MREMAEESEIPLKGRGNVVKSSKKQTAPHSTSRERHVLLLYRQAQLSLLLLPTLPVLYADLPPA